MKKALVIVIAMFAIACKKNNPPQTPPSSINNPTNLNNPNNPAPSNNAYFIPNWYSNDTLVGEVLDSNNQFNGIIDTIFTLSIKDTSYIIYGGKRYYIWTETLTGLDSFEIDASQYNNCVISPTTNVKDAISESLLNIAVPYKHKDQQGSWSYRRQVLIVNDWKNFKKVNLGGYIAISSHN